VSTHGDHRQCAARRDAGAGVLAEGGATVPRRQCGHHLRAFEDVEGQQRTGIEFEAAHVNAGVHGVIARPSKFRRHVRVEAGGQVADAVGGGEDVGRCVDLVVLLENPQRGTLSERGSPERLADVGGQDCRHAVVAVRLPGQHRLVHLRMLAIRARDQPHVRRQWPTPRRLDVLDLPDNAFGRRCHPRVEDRCPYGHRAAPKADVDRRRVFGCQPHGHGIGGGIDRPGLGVAAGRCVIGRRRHCSNEIGRLVILDRFAVESGLGGRRFLDAVECGADVQIHPTRRKRFAEADSADRLRDCAGSQRHVAGQLRPRRQGVPDFQKGRGRAHGQTGDVDEAQHMRNLLLAAQSGQLCGIDGA
jgi:hypothetical protein